MSTIVALSGDSIINRRISVCDNPSIKEYFEVFAEADVGFTHLETLIHDFDRDDLYPNAVAGGHWLQAPGYIADELRTLGFDMVSHASNHALDYGYGGLFSTWDHLDRVGIPHAGTGENLAAATEPAYLESGEGIVSLVSMTTSFADAHRAGEARRDAPGRPGVNPLKFNYAVDTETRETLQALAEQMGWWVTQKGSDWLFNPPGARRVLPFKFVESTDTEVSDAGGMLPQVNPNDRAMNLASIKEANAQSDITIAHIHTHAWDTQAGTSVPPKFLPRFAHDAIDTGADIVICQGTHTPLRGIELYDSQPIFYDPGDFIFMTDSITRLPQEYYERYADELDTPLADARSSDAHTARGDIVQMGDAESSTDPDEEEYFGGIIHNPPGGYFAAPVLGNIVPVCTFDTEFSIESIEIHPGKLLDTPKLHLGVPERVHGTEAATIIDHIATLSEQFDTTIERDGDTGTVVLP